MDTAPPAYPRYAELRARQLAQHRARAVAAARTAAAAAARQGAQVTVFGSLAEGRFHRDSDLDLALNGPAECLADVVRLDQASARLAARIREHGRDPAALE